MSCRHIIVDIASLVNWFIPLVCRENAFFFLFIIRCSLLVVRDSLFVVRGSFFVVRRLLFVDCCSHDALFFWCSDPDYGENNWNEDILWKSSCVINLLNVTRWIGKIKEAIVLIFTRRSHILFGKKINDNNRWIRCLVIQ